MVIKSTQRRMGGVELSFSANIGKATYKLADLYKFREMTGQADMYKFTYLCLKLYERFSGTLKGFISHKFGGIELYITGGIKVKNVKYSCVDVAQFSTVRYTHNMNYQSKKQTHMTPVLGCGIKFPFKDSCFMRLEYTFEFPVKLKLSLAEDQDGRKFGSERVKHNVHSMKLGIGTMF